MKKLQALYNDNTSKIFEQATQEKNAIENLNFLIDLAMVTIDMKPIPEEPKTFTDAWNHPNVSHAELERSNQKGIHWHEQATGMVQDKQKFYAP